MTYDVLILVDYGIGNAIEALYAVEYCLTQNVKVGFHMGGISADFQEYIKDSYGPEVVVASLNGIRARHLIHSFTYLLPISVEHENYFYVSADACSSKVLSETEQYLSVVRALYPSSYASPTLTRLKHADSPAVEKLGSQLMYVLYPGGSAINSARRWPYYGALMEKLGADRVMVVGGRDDVDYSYSYFYPKFLTGWLPQPVMNRLWAWRLLRKAGLLAPHAHLRDLEGLPNVYIDRFSWAELTAIFRRCRVFIGNDGGLTHLAAAAGARGYVLFGPTSIDKNKPFNQNMKPVSTSYECQPCQFQAGKILMTKLFINCPYQVRCLYAISAEDVAGKVLMGNSVD